MVLLYNVLGPIVFLGLMFLSFKLRKLWPAACAMLFIVLYTLAQPSYMPKGTVKQMPKVEFQQVNTPIVDRGMKTKSSEQYDIERQQAFDAIDKSIKNQIKLNKE